VAGLGVQVLFGLRDPSAMAAVLLIGPVAYHRLVFRRGLKERLMRFANVLAILGLAAVASAVLAAMLLLTWYVAGAVAGAVVTALIGVLIAALWSVVPIASREDRQ
jgi:hypothetical protein